MVSLLSGCDVLWSIDRVPPPDAPGPCVVTDDFTGTRLANTWVTYTDQNFAVAQDGALRLDLTGAVNSLPGQALARYDRSFDMTGGSMEIEVVQVINAHPNLENFARLRVTGDDTSNYTIVYHEGQIDFRTRNDAHRTRAYNRQADRFWRIVNGPEPTDVSWQTRGSPDEAWFTEVTMPAIIPFSSMEAKLVAGSYNDGAPDPGVTIYDNFKVCDAQQL